MQHQRKTRPQLIVLAASVALLVLGYFTPLPDFKSGETHPLQDVH